MLAIYDTIEMDTIVRRWTTLQCVTARPITVSGNTFFLLHGTFNGNLVLTPGAQVHVYGTVNGDIINKCGHLEVFVTVQGKVVRENGDTVIGLGAVVRDGVH